MENGFSKPIQLSPAFHERDCGNQPLPVETRAKRQGLSALPFCDFKIFRCPARSTPISMLQVRPIEDALQREKLHS
jgi:hypothetical protein